MSERPFHLQLFSHLDGSGTGWDLASIGLILHTTQAASQNPGPGWNCRPWTAEGGVCWDKNCRDWCWQFNVISTKPHRQTLMLSSLPLGWKIAVRLIGGWVFAWLLTGLVKPEPGQVSALLSGLDLWSCVWFWDSEHQTTLGRGSSLKSLLSNLACMDLLPKGLKHLKSLLEGVSLTTAV